MKNEKHESIESNESIKGIEGIEGVESVENINSEEAKVQNGSFISTTKASIFNTLQEEILNSDLPDDEKEQRLLMLSEASSRKINLMLVGSSGAGKSSTINALFDMSVAKVGVGVDPETRDIVKYELGNLTIWDTPGLGDNLKKDKLRIKKIAKKLTETDDEGSLLIDLVMVVMDASSKDLAVPYDVINNTLIPCLGNENTHRILIGLNQSDMAMKGRHWDCEQNAPDSVLSEFLEKKAKSIKKRISKATGVEVEPICYCAGYTDGTEKQNPYNLSKLLYYILQAVPAEKRLILVDNLNTDESNWTSNDNSMDYSEAVRTSFFKSLLSDVGKGAEKGALAGVVIGLPGMLIGGLIGSIIGGFHALVVRPLFKRSLFVRQAT